MNKSKNTFCHPKDDRSEKWILVFEDTERSPIYFTEKDAAFKAWGFANTAWNCHLYVSEKIDRVEVFNKNIKSKK